LTPWKTTISGGTLQTGRILIKGLWVSVFLVFVLLLHSTTLYAAQIIIDSEEQFHFAEQAMAKGEYMRAVVELERFIHFFPDDPKVPEARLLVGLCYLKAKDYESARKVFDTLHRTYPEQLLGGKALLLMGESYYRQGIYQEAEHYFQEVAETYAQPELRNSAIYRLGWCRMQTRNWKEASETFKAVGPPSSLYATSQDLARRSLEGETLPYKDPTTAGVLAGLLPGLGHVYCDRYRDGLVAFLLNGLFVWASLESFNNDNNVLGGMLAFLELGWYSGNIYSAVNSAQKLNRKLKDDFLQGLPDSLKLGLLSTREGHLGLALSFRF
jgi:tetratricopeptide (TPR) repeat protein